MQNRRRYRRADPSVAQAGRRRGWPAR